MDTPKLHIFFFPFGAPGHVIPMIDTAKLFCKRGVKSTLLTTSHEESLFSRSIERIRKLGLDISLLTMELPLQEVGLPLPEHCRILQSLTSPEMLPKFMTALRMLDKQLEKLIEEHKPDCLISDTFFPWTLDVALKFGIPRLVFHGTSHFSIGAAECVMLYKPHMNVSFDSEPFLMTNFPGDITMTRDKLPDSVKKETDFTKFHTKMLDSGRKSYGDVVNSFYELEPNYADYHRDYLGRRSWRVGPVSLCNEEIDDKLERGSMETVGNEDYLKWLDSKETDSVVYICFGSMAKFSSPQLHEIAIGLEASGQNFIWVVKKNEGVEEGSEEWLPEGYEERIKGKGLVLRGWVPQVLLLEHRAVGGFVTHCGWNSSLEGISAGLPMVTWPVAAEQFYNEKLITEVLKIGVPVGVKKWVRWVGDSVASEQVEKAVRRVMIGDEAEEMRVKAKELSKMAKNAVEEGGSSHSDIKALIEELKAIKLAACQ